MTKPYPVFVCQATCGSPLTGIATGSPVQIQPVPLASTVIPVTSSSMPGHTFSESGTVPV
ncbi:MAG: hypothetical protein R2719_05830 [Micropruina sp.]